jgi:hypothetical protein
MLTLTISLPFGAASMRPMKTGRIIAKYWGIRAEAALENDGVRRNRLTAESGSRFKSVERDSGFRSFPSEPIAL